MFCVTTEDHYDYIRLQSVDLFLLNIPQSEIRCLFLCKNIKLSVIYSDVWEDVSVDMMKIR